MKKLTLLLILSILLTFSGCFQILHFVGLNDDGSINVYWQFDISKSLAEKDAQEAKKKGKNKESIKEKINKTKNDLPKKLKKYVTDLKVEEIKDEYLTGIAMSFKVKKYVNLPKEDRFVLLPRYNKKKKTLLLPFEADKDAKKKKKQEKSTKKDDMGMEQIFNSIFSSAKYQLVLGGKYEPVRAKVYGKTTKKNYEVKITRLGDQYLISIPFMSISMKEIDGFDLIVKLK